MLEHTWAYLNPAGFEARGWVQIYKQNGGGRGVDNFPRKLISYKKYGGNLRATGGRELFFPNYLRLIRIVQMRGVSRCMRKTNGGGGFKVQIG